MLNRTIALGNNFALLPWHVRVYLGTEDTIVIKTLATERVKSLEKML